VALEARVGGEWQSVGESVPVTSDGAAPVVDLPAGVRADAVRVVMTARDNTHMIVSEIEVLAKVPGEPSPVWETSVRYRAGDEVFHDGAYHQAAWTTKKEPGGSAHGAWEEILRAGDGTAVWTASRVFVRGEVVVHEGDTYRAKWWTRNQEPGDRFGPWQVVGS
jgi:chitodextrinase